MQLLRRVLALRKQGASPTAPPGEPEVQPGLGLIPVPAEGAAEFIESATPAPSMADPADPAIDSVEAEKAEEEPSTPPPNAPMPQIQAGCTAVVAVFQVIFNSHLCKVAFWDDLEYDTCLLGLSACIRADATQNERKSCSNFEPALQGNELYVANAGDSRAVLCRGPEAVALSEDHKPASEVEKARITAAGGFISSVGGVIRCASLAFIEGGGAAVSIMDNPQRALIKIT